jgi:hypothetical protein
MKSFNMVSLMAKASKNNKKAVARSEEAKKEALAAREAKEAERKAREAERLVKEAERKEKKTQAQVVTPLEVLHPGTEGLSEKEISTVNLDDVKFVLKDWKKSLLANPKQFWETLGNVRQVAVEHNVSESLRLLDSMDKALTEYGGLVSRLNELRTRQSTVRDYPMAKVTPWDVAAREAVVLAEDAFGAYAPEIGKEAKRLLNDINLTK